MQHFQLVKKSQNGKTGPIPVSTSTAVTCPDACIFKANGCYAEAGYYTRLNWSKVNDGARGTSWSSFIEAVKRIKPAQIWRHNVAGDLPGVNNDIDSSMLAELTEANTGKRGFTYTHKPVLDNPSNAKAVKQANEQGFTVNLSANNLKHADELKALNIGPVAVVVPEHTERLTYTPAGNKVVICPAQQKDNVTCETCGLCAIAKRNTIIGFRAHGKSKNKVSQLVK
jgi:hypothetical protein